MRILILIAALALSACGGGDPEPEQPATIQPVNCSANPAQCK
jgi:hypothetical protein